MSRTHTNAELIRDRSRSRNLWAGCACNAIADDWFTKAYSKLFGHIGCSALEHKHRRSISQERVVRAIDGYSCSPSCQLPKARSKQVLRNEDGILLLIEGLNVTLCHILLLSARGCIININAGNHIAR